MYLVIPLKYPSELADQAVQQQFASHEQFCVDNRNKGS